MDTQSFKQKVKREEYELHFHSRAHYVSADHYENLGRRLTYLKLMCGGVATVLGVNATNSMMKVEPIFHSKAVVGCLAATAALTGLNSTEYDPGTKKKLHNSAASRMKELSKKMGAWSDGILDTVSFEQNDVLLKTYSEFLDEHRKIEEKIIKSEDWTFSEVHDTLPKEWKDRGNKLGKYSPERDKWYCFQRYVKCAEPAILAFGATAVSFALWKFVSKQDGGSGNDTPRP